MDAGARFLHVVDLDGARHGSPRSLHHLERIKRELGIPVQYGGGLRSLPAVRDALRAGADRVIIGTAAYTDLDFLDDVVAAFGDRVLVAVDTRGGLIATAGWTHTTQMPAEAVIGRLQDRGVRSSSTRTSTATGCSRAPTSRRSSASPTVVRGRFLYSGGIGQLDDLEALVEPAPGEPRGRHQRQGALRAALHGRRGAGRARRAASRCTSSASSRASTSTRGAS